MSDAVTRAAHRLQQLFKRITALIRRMLIWPSQLRNHSRGGRRRSFGSIRQRRRSLENLSQEIEHLFTAHLAPRDLLDMSKRIRGQLKSCAKSNPVCMLPSFNSALPTGNEKGTYLAVDVGGSTLRVALVELAGKSDGMRIIRMTASHIDESVKLLEGKAFFAWMAERIEEMLDVDKEKYTHDSDPLPMGLSWSFPIDQTSIRSGLVISMGKGFLCSNGTVGCDLSELIMEGCRNRNLNVRMDAIVNDSSATLLSRAYTDPSTRMSLILGTGTNSAIHFPVHAISMEKFGSRPPEWFAQADHVIVNTELSMFGGGVFPMTRWDEILNRTHLKPDYQPLEHMAAGRYLGEIVRLILVEAVKTAGLFGGELPHSLKNAYSFETSIAAFIEEDTSPSLTASSAYLQKHHTFPLPPSPTDLAFLKRICGYVSNRAAAYLAAAIHGLWCLRNESESQSPSPLRTPSKEDLNLLELSLDDTTNTAKTNTETVVSPDEAASVENLTIACDGSVINKYPGFRDRCQRYLDGLTATGDASLPPTSDECPTQSKQAISISRPTPTIVLDPAPESAIFGAAVAVGVAVS
ncbi:hypothetical protein AJ80_09944 [Polytolypa hystricis UAMH7299]|uniref:Phosphotransferase n=1 Tax=Polytolypa hystricis (strain UAMH7299) TaxID=1447883 RepID=A0A2B7WG88_POLH7|nr:hypothetical protein AJ80_09944 [Polytolypa hystricis UAMH7299]